MNMCRLVWEIPIIEGEHYNPIMYAIYNTNIRKCQKIISYGRERSKR